MDNTKKRENLPELTEAFQKILLAHRKGCRQERVFKRIQGLAMAEILALGRHTTTQIIMGMGLEEEDWSAWYRLFSKNRFSGEKMLGILAQQVLRKLPAEGHVVAAVDGFHLPKCSQKMPGTHWSRGLKTAKFRPGLQRTQHYVEGSILPPIEAGYTRAIPVACLPAFPPKAVPSDAKPQTESEAGAKCLQALRRQANKVNRHHQRILALADGGFDTLTFWRSKPAKTDIIVRTAKNRALFKLPRGRKPGPGAPPKYGEQVDAPGKWVNKRAGFKRKSIVVRGLEKRLRYRLEGPFLRDGLPDAPMFLLVIGGGKRPQGSRRKNYKPCYFLVSAVSINGRWKLPIPLKELLVWIWQRWEVEVAHRELKTNFGLGQKQNWHSKATVAVVQWSIWCYGLLVLAGYSLWGIIGGPDAKGRWRRSRGRFGSSGRWSFSSLSRVFRSQLWALSELKACCFPSLDNWPLIEDFVSSLNNFVGAASFG